MTIERFTVKLAFAWASFRMAADILRHLAEWAAIIVALYLIA